MTLFMFLQKSLIFPPLIFPPLDDSPAWSSPPLRIRAGPSELFPACVAASIDLHPSYPSNRRETRGECSFSRAGRGGAWSSHPLIPPLLHLPPSPSTTLIYVWKNNSRSDEFETLLYPYSRYLKRYWRFLSGIIIYNPLPIVIYEVLQSHSSQFEEYNK